MTPLGTVHESVGGAYTVELDGGDRIEAAVRGRLKRDARAGSAVVIGDRVRVAGSSGAWTIESVEPRHSVLARRGHGRAAKVLAANLDRVFAVVAARDPTPTGRAVDRLLVLVEAAGLKPSLVVNKMDLVGSPAEDEQAERVRVLASLYRALGYEVIEVSAGPAPGDGHRDPSTGADVDALRERCREGVSALIGPSGVGKSSLLNALAPGLDLRVGEVSRRTRTGRQTTVGARLIRLPSGGLVADTPGFGEVGLWRVPSEDLAGFFPEIDARSEGCRFRSCSHLHEPECAVLEALAMGAIASSRYESYRALREEAAGESPMRS